MKSPKFPWMRWPGKGLAEQREKAGGAWDFVFLCTGKG
jgi:hypothetical protein